MRDNNYSFNSPIRVLCVFGCLDRGGAETMCMNLYRHIDRTKVQFDFVKHTDKACAFDEEIKSLGGRIYSAPRFKGWNLIAYLRWWDKHLKQHPEHQIVHGHYFSISGLYFWIAKRNGRITVAHSHATSLLPDHRIIEKGFLFLCGKYSDYRLACSKAAGDFFFGKKDYTVLKNAIDTEKFSFDAKRRAQMRTTLNIEDNFVLGAVGRIEQIKNPFGIVRIFREVLDRNDKARLLWVGDGPCRSAVEAELEQLGIKDKVIMTGVRDDVDHLLQAMDVFVFPSFREGLGLVAIEAQAAGLFCFISDSVTEEVNITQLCSFLPLDQPALWAEKILSVSCGRRDTSQLIRDAGYSIAQTAKQLQEFYCGILQDKN